MPRRGAEKSIERASVLSFKVSAALRLCASNRFDIGIVEADRVLPL